MKNKNKIAQFPITAPKAWIHRADREESFHLSPGVILVKMQGDAGACAYPLEVVQTCSDRFPKGARIMIEGQMVRVFIEGADTWHLVKESQVLATIVS